MYTVSQYGLGSWEGSFIKGVLWLKVLEGGNLSLSSKWTFFTVAQTVKSLPAMLETGFNPWVRKIHGRREWQSTPVFLPGKSHRPREDPIGLQFRGSQRVRHDWAIFTCSFFSSHVRIMRVGPYRRLRAKKLMLSNCGGGEDKSPLDYKDIKPVNS